MTLYELRRVMHAAIDEHSAAEVLNELALVIDEHTEEHIRPVGRRHFLSLRTLSVNVGRLSARARALRV